MLSPQQKRAIYETLIAIVVFAIIGAAIRFIIPRSYSSSAALLFPGATSQVGNIPGWGGGVSGENTGITPSGGGSDQPSLELMQGVLNVPQPGTSPATAGMIVKSRKTTDEIINRFDLLNVWHTSYERAVMRLQEDLKCIAGPSGDLRIIYTDTSPERAKDIASAALNILTDSIEQLSLDPAGKNLQFLEKSLKKAERDCDEAQKALVDYQKSIGGASPDAQAQSLTQTYTNIHEALITAKAELAVTDSHESTSKHLNDKMIKMGQDPSNSEKTLLSILYYKVAEDERNLKTLRQKYTDKQPEVVMAKRQLEVDRESLKKEISRQSNALHAGSSPYISQNIVSNTTAKAKVAELENSLSKIRKELESLPKAQAEFGLLTMNLRDERSRLSLVRSEYVKAQLIAKSRGPQFVILDSPVKPLRPNGRSPWLYASLGALLGFVIVGGKWLVIGLKQSLDRE